MNCSVLATANAEQFILDDLLAARWGPARRGCWRGRSDRWRNRWRRARPGRPNVPEVHPPDPVVPDIHDVVEVEVGRVAAVRLPEVRAPDPVVADVDDGV